MRLAILALLLLAACSRPAEPPAPPRPTTDERIRNPSLRRATEDLRARAAILRQRSPGAGYVEGHVSGR